ncbi:MAG: SDR family oxidoreductase [Phycisphaerales bacterium]|nr:SDR family oxidoreductase [Phycisphaerales bacterium]
MTTLVTGGTGLVGINLVRALAENGEIVRILVRPSSLLVGLDLPGIESATGDVTDLESVRRAMTGCTRVYHAAAWVSMSPWRTDLARAVNVGGTANVCRAALETRVERLVHVSSIAAVGHGPIDQPADENTPWNFAAMRSPYYATKHDAETIVRQHVDRGLDAVIVNPAYIIGPWDVRPGSGRSIILCATKRLHGCPARGGTSVVDVREVVAGMRAAMDRGRRGERYILAGENMTCREFLTRVARIAGVEPPRRAIPFGLIYLPAIIATGIHGLNPRWCPDFNLGTLRAAYCDHYVTARKARQELKLQSLPIEHAIADTLQWFENHGYLTRTPNGWRSSRP